MLLEKSTNLESYLSRFLLIILFLGAPLSFTGAQNYHFMEYSAKDDMCDNFVYNITQGKNGYLWLGTGEGICRFDGFEFVSQFRGDTLPRTPVKNSFRDSRDRIWFGYDNGQIAVLDDISFKLLNPPEDQSSVINGFGEDEEGNILIATQDRGIIRLDEEFNFNYYKKGVENQFISTIELLNGEDVLIGTFSGLYLYKFLDDTLGLELVGRFEEIPYTKVQNIIPSPHAPGEYYIATADEGVFRLILTEADIQLYTIEKIGTEFDLHYSNVQSVYEDKYRNLWLGTWGEGVVKLEYSSGSDGYTSASRYDETNGIAGNYIQTLFEDLEGILWIGTYGEGMSALIDRSFSFYTSEEEEFNNDIHSLLQLDDKYLLGSENGILITDLSGENEGFIGVRNGLPADRITSLFQDSSGTVWVGTSKSGIYQLNSSLSRATRFFSSQNSLENMINRINGIGDDIWVATNGGVFHFNLRNGTREHFTTRNQLPHNKIKDVFIDNEGEVWIASPSNGIYSITLKEALKIDAPAELDFVSITQDSEGVLWAVTNGDGVFEFDRDSLKYYSDADGLRNNYCYSVAEDDSGNIWIGHRLGMSKINRGREIINTYSVDEGITADCNNHAVINNNNNQLVFGTSEGLIFYDPSTEDQDTVPPVLNITSLTISDQEYDFTEPVFLPYDIYKIRIDFRGINLSNPEKVLYQYKLDGYDEWSEPTSIPYVIYSRVEDGDYTFMLRACDENGACTEDPLTLKISVKIPIWKAWWFILTLIVVLLLTVYLIIVIRERKQKQLQEYLQRSLDERTKEVREQAQEIENKNRDITDSINYAQRIQASILPPIKRLHDTFTGSFVFYQPRDIVSGDFYWYDKVWGDKFVIVCADSTGHGVPGAFMSMIGTTLIKDICSRPDVDSPSRILETLDQEVQEALNQNKEAEKSNDGMDIIVAEINLTTNYLRVASAMRPLILYLNGEQVYVKGSRNSVGGRFDEEIENKSFKDEGFQLKPGDLIYMFSDGYPDQFGGPLGKKFKMVRLKNLLRDIHTKPLDEQYNYIKSNFMLWKEDLEQVDDVLFMGIKI
jgi:ligand-binding sensor domain-containing protein/serine phosphatase RsbU (regulator of sigma subunit)